VGGRAGWAAQFEQSLRSLSCFIIAKSSFYYPTDKKFNAQVNRVEIAPRQDSVNLGHLVSPKDRLRVILPTQ
jgi:hypothetical protein